MRSCERVGQKALYKQDCIPVGCVPPAHWPYTVAVVSTGGGGMHAPCHACPPTTHAPCHTCHPCHAHHPPPCMPPCHAHLHHACPPCHAHTPPPVNRMTDRCKNITLPQTSFAGGKNIEKHAQTFVRLLFTEAYQNSLNYNKTVLLP